MEGEVWHGEYRVTYEDPATGENGRATFETEAGARNHYEALYQAGFINLALVERKYRKIDGTFGKPGPQGPL